jgi:hypothetical protein
MSTTRKPAGAKMSKGRVDSTDAHREGRGQFEKPPRGKRKDTPEAREQREKVAKTHPTRNPVAARKDKREMPGDDYSNTIGVPAPVRRGKGRKSGVGRGT